MNRTRGRQTHPSQYALHKKINGKSATKRISCSNLTDCGTPHIRPVLTWQDEQQEGDHLMTDHEDDGGVAVAAGGEHRKGVAFGNGLSRIRPISQDLWEAAA